MKPLWNLYKTIWNPYQKITYFVSPWITQPLSEMKPRKCPPSRGTPDYTSRVYHQFFHNPHMAWGGNPTLGLPPSTKLPGMGWNPTPWSYHVTDSDFTTLGWLTIVVWSDLTTTLTSLHSLVRLSLILLVWPLATYFTSPTSLKLRHDFHSVWL